MINPTGYVLRCDESGCDTDEITSDNRFWLTDHARAEGWQLDVKLNGVRAKRGGKDYCPEHRKGA